MKSFKMVSLAVAMTAIPTLTTTTAFAAEKQVYISIDRDALNFSEKTFGNRVEEISTQDGISIIKIDEEAIPWLSMLMHKNFNRCGGFMQHDDEADAMELLASQSGAQLFAKNNTFADYSLTQEAIVKPLINEVKAENILATITKLSSFKNRYYKGEFGKASAAFIKETWTALVKNRTDATVEYFPHSAWDQPSIILTLKGKSDETIVLGGHQDSINGSFGGAAATAPGADDNASGISTITEVIRILADSSYQPEKTIKFMAYAAEEVGLLGSKEIAKSFKTKGVNVIGVMQLDMTNFQGTKDLDIVMMRDYTNEQQNAFVGTIIDKYVPGIKWGYDKCGYGCSDHASWNAQGYPASMPFEARMNDMNHNIHTARDTLSVSGGNASHAAKFAKMAVAFVVELDR
ncbi:M20/M25/M40 family metallo-hydrolase [Bacteriovorax sp. PP10]|uniref:M20/M25/M40 family metallo-hydrolase n=1 Tax=Bacteriovorax antarcticus TaxID=3088717 RepID=A0ABU5VS54_9BACT|nr:M20/M25/M40 family metallo-hydrolase [Bacteriovorax sp. PP10]MEA9355223.1 M20/M25/M40 family metallo-hydrolase [Bacteriovorax sp. PP10]